MTRAARHLGPLVAIGIVAGLLAAGQATAAIPSSGSAPAGVGPSFAPIGSSGAKVVKRLGLKCAPVYRGSATRRCYTALNAAGDGFVSINGAGKIEAWTFYSGRWNTGHGVGRGSAIAAVRAAYGSKLKVRKNRTWTYLDLPQTVAGQPRLTSFIGRTKYGDIVTLNIQRVRRNIIQPAQAVTPVGQDLVLRFADFAPRELIRPELKGAGQARSTSLPEIRTDARGDATLTLPRASGPLAQLLAARPIGSAPLTLTVAVSGVTRRPVSLQVAPPAPPAFSFDLPVMSSATPGTFRVTAPEPGVFYVISAAWTCRDGTIGRVAEATRDEVYSPTGAGLALVPDVDAIRGGLFNADCTGTPTPATAPVTLTLFRRTQRDSDVIVFEQVAQLTVAVSSAEPADPL